MLHTSPGSFDSDAQKQRVLAQDDNSLTYLNSTTMKRAGLSLMFITS